jgi:cell division protein FtsB
MHWFNRILLASLVAAGVAWGPAQFQTATASGDLARVRRERDGLRDVNADLREHNRLLQAEVHALQSDPREIARIAREDLNLVAPGEVVFEVEHVTKAVPARDP